MHWNWTVDLNTAATEEPVSLAEMKVYLRVQHGDDDTAITNLIVSARQWAESFTNRQLVTATWDLYMEEFHGATRLLIPKPPLGSITTFAFLDTGGNSQTWDASNFTVNTVALPGEVTEAFGISWPAVRKQYNAITITYVAGYGAASAVPEAIKNAIHLMVQKQYDDPENKMLEERAEALLWPYRTWYDAPWR